MNLKYIKEIFSQTKDLIGSQSGIAVISIIQVSFVVNQLGPEKYGAVVLLIAIPSLIFRATHARNSDVNLLVLKDGKSFYFESIFFNLLTGIGGFIICLIIFTNPLVIDSFIGIYFGIETLSNVLIIYLFTRIIQTFSETSKSILIFNNDLRKYSILEITSVVIRFIALVILLLNDPSIENYLIAQSIYGITFGLFGLYLSYKYCDSFGLKIQLFKSYLKAIKSSYGKVRYDQIIGLIPQHFDVILLAVLVDIQTVGIYQFAKRLVEPINYLVVTFNPWLQNKLKSEDIEFKIASFVRQVLLPISIFLFVVYFIFGRNLILFIGNEGFLNSFEPMMVLLIGFVTYLLSFWIRQYLLFKDLIQFHAYGRIIYSLVFLVLALLLYDSFSSLGIAIALSSAMVLQKLFEYTIYLMKIKSN
ncbi:MAG: lipopolysaccharide biosynthesis protein [Candidatus Actinomarina sp.]